MMEARGVARLRGATQTALETTALGREQLVTLHEQGKTLERVNRRLDDVDVALNQGERTLRSMTFWGRVRNFFSLDRTQRAWKWLPNDADDNGDDNGATAATKSATSVAAQRQKSSVGGAHESEEAALLDMLGNSVGELKEIATAMSGELTHHDALLREATAKVDRSHARTKALTYKAQRV